MCWAFEEKITKNEIKKLIKLKIKQKFPVAAKQERNKNKKKLCISSRNYKVNWTRIKIE